MQNLKINVVKFHNVFSTLQSISSLNPIKG